MTTKQQDDASSEPGEFRSSDQLGLGPERDEVLAQLDDRTNQTWAWKRARWARLVRAQDAEIEHLKLAEEGAKEAFRHVVEQKHAAEAECLRLRGLLDDAYAQIRRQAALMANRA